MAEKEEQGKRRVSGRTNIYISEKMSEIIGEIDFGSAGLSRTLQSRLELLEDILSRTERSIRQKLTEEQILAITKANWSHAFAEETGGSISSTESTVNLIDSYPYEVDMTEAEHKELCTILKDFSPVEGYALNRVVMKMREELTTHN